GRGAAPRAGLPGRRAPGAAVPSLYVEHLAKKNLEEGRHPLDLSSLPTAYALGVAQMSVLKAVGVLTAPAFPYGGLAQGAGRVATQAATGPFAPAPAGLATPWMGKDIGSGTVGQGLNGDPPGALRHTPVPP